MFKLKLIFICSFFFFILFDIIITNYTGLKSTQIKNYYNKFLNLNYFSIFTLLFIIFTTLFFTLSWLFPSVLPIDLFPIEFSFELE
jgi:hypothetical protein